MGRLEFKNNKDEIGSIRYTEENIQFALNNYFTPNSVKYAIDGQYVFEWESDKLIMMRTSGLIYEFEIKISKADFKNDFKNKQRKHTILEGKKEYVPEYYEKIEKVEKSKLNEDRKKQELEWIHKHFDNNAYYNVKLHKKPNFFYYVTPVNMLDVNDIPSYAGLIEINDYGTFITVKKAPKLHNEKYTPDDLNLSDKFYYNMDTWRKKYEKQMDEIQHLKDTVDKLTGKEGNKKKTYGQIEAENEKLKRDNKVLDTAWKQSKEQLDKLRNDYYNKCDENRMLKREIKKINPDFDFDKLWHGF